MSLNWFEESARLEAENKRLSARVAEAEDQLKAAGASLVAKATEADVLLAERDALRAELEKALVMVPQDITDELTSLRAEVESLKAQLAEAQALHDDALRQVGFHVRAANGLEEALSIERTRHASTSEQLRVAREHIEGIRRYVREVQPTLKTRGEFMEAFAWLNGAALSASAPKARSDEEIAEDTKRIRREAHERYMEEQDAAPKAEHDAKSCDAVACMACLSVPSQDLPCPVCDDVTLMKVAMAVREVCAKASVDNYYAAKSVFDAAIRSVDLAAIVAEAKR